MNFGATRRRFFAIAGTSPLAAKAAVDKTISDLTGVSLNGVDNTGGVPSAIADVTPDQYKLVIFNPISRRAIEEILYEQERHVGRLDVDLASYRSFSMAARIAFQRQRNVEQRMIDLQRDYSWNRLSGIARKLFGI